MPHIVAPIPIDLDTRRHLRFNFAGVMRAEQELTRFWGREYYFLEALQRMLVAATTGDLTQLSFVNLSIVVWQGCRHEDAQLTLAQVQEAMPHIGDARAITRLVKAVLDAWDAGMPKEAPSEEAPDDASPLDGSTGLAIGPLLVSTSA